jgi:translation initiation factor 3 subunit B
LKQYSERYNAIDSARQKIVSHELLEKRKKMMDDFALFRRNALRRIEQQRQERLELRDGLDTDELGNEEDQVEYTVQFLVETKKEEVVE